MEFNDAFISELERQAVLKGANVTFSQEKNLINADVEFSGFTVKIKYTNEMSSGYSFLEGTEIAKCLLTKFKFSFSNISYSIYDIHNTVDDKIFTTYDFHSIYNANDLTNAIDTVFDFITRNYDKISSIPDDMPMQAKLIESFEKGLAVAKKKVTPEMYCSDVEKYEESLDIALYFLRYNETAFTDFIVKGKVNQLQRFYAKNSKKCKLLPFEERYLEYLYEHDFKVCDEKITNDTKDKYKTSRLANKSSNTAILISLALGFITNFLTDYIINATALAGYTTFCSFSRVDTIIYFLLLLGFYLLICTPVEKLIKSKKGIYRKRTPLTIILLVVFGVALVAGGITLDVYDTEKAVAVSSDDVFVNSHNEKQHYSYDKIKFYLIEGEYYDGEYLSGDDYKSYVMIINNDYENYYQSYSYSDLKSVIETNATIEHSFKTIEDFEQEFQIKI